MSDPSLGGANINLDNLTEAEYDDLMLFVHRYDKRTGAELWKKLHPIGTFILMLLVVPGPFAHYFVNITFATGLSILAAYIHHRQRNKFFGKRAEQIQAYIDERF